MPPQLGSEAYPDGAYYPYAVVPENLTQIDKLKIGADVTETTHVYGLLYHGSTENRYRNFERDFGGFDVRLTDRTIDGLKWTGYAKLNYETNQSPTTLISGEQLTFDRFDESEVECTWWDNRQYAGCGCEPVAVPCVIGEDGVPDFFASDALVPLIAYTRTTTGVNGRWTPFRDERTWRRGLAFYGRYEYRLLHRENADFDGTLEPAVVAAFEQPTTDSHIIHVGTSQKWSRAYDTFVRYTMRYDSQPLYGVRSSNGTTNSSLPIHTHLVEMGGTWAPAANLLANLTFGIQNRFQDSAVADFDEDSYPLTVSVWYAPTPALSFSAGYAYLTNWVRQAITLGDDFNNGEPYAARHAELGLRRPHAKSGRWAASMLGLAVCNCAAISNTCGAATRSPRRSSTSPTFGRRLRNWRRTGWTRSACRQASTTACTLARRATSATTT